MVDGVTRPAPHGGAGWSTPPSVLEIGAAEGTDAVVTARRWARSTTAGLELGHLAEDAELIVSELVTNPSCTRAPPSASRWAGAATGSASPSETVRPTGCP